MAKTELGYGVECAIEEDGGETNSTIGSSQMQTLHKVSTLALMLNIEYNLIGNANKHHIVPNKRIHVCRERVDRWMDR